MRALLSSAALAIVSLSILALPQNTLAQSQAEMNQEAAQDFETADKALNSVYKKLSGKIDEESQAKLKAAQKAWIVFRDAEAELIADIGARGGSMYSMIYDGERATLTKARTAELQKILKEYGQQ
jgi:uncharacterized protein YecT (DUF1311 family)